MHDPLLPSPTSPGSAFPSDAPADIALFGGEVEAILDAIADLETHQRYLATHQESGTVVLAASIALPMLAGTLALLRTRLAHVTVGATPTPPDAFYEGIVTQVSAQEQATTGLICAMAANRTSWQAKQAARLFGCAGRHHA